MDEHHTHAQSLLLLHDHLWTVQQNEEAKHSDLVVLARYLVHKRDLDSWSLYLSEGNNDRDKLTQVVIQDVIPETEDADDISATIKAFMGANMVKELMSLLESLVFGNSLYSGQYNIQNLLLHTAIDASPKQVMDYVNRLHNFDPIDIGSMALQVNLYEEAFVIFHKFNMNTTAIQVLINQLSDLQRAHQFAQQCNETEVWGALGKAQLTGGKVHEAIDSFIKADDHSSYKDVIAASKLIYSGSISGLKYEELTKFLLRAREKVKDTCIDESLIFIYAHTGALSELREFLLNPHDADVDTVASHLKKHGMLDAARICENLKSITVESDDEVIEICDDDLDKVIKDVIVIEDDEGEETNKVKEVTMCVEGKKAAAMDTVASILECKICLQRLENPKTLACQHLFCKACLEGILLFNMDGSVRIICPLRCLPETKLGSNQTLDDLGTSYEIKAIIETLNNTSKGSDSVVKKTVCSYISECGNDISVYCCGSVMCQTCLLKHSDSSLLHQRCTKLTTDPDDGTVVVFCEKHSSGCKHFCTDHRDYGTGENHFLCVYCLNRDHKGHDLGTVAMEADKLKRILQDSLKANKKLQQLRQTTEDMILQCKEKLDQVLQENKRLREYYTSSLITTLSLPEQERKIKSDLNSAASLHMAQYPVPLETSYFEEKLKKSGIELLIERNEILHKLSQQNVTVLNSTQVVLATDTYADWYLGELKVNNYLVHFSVLDPSVSTFFDAFTMPALSCYTTNITSSDTIPVPSYGAADVASAHQVHDDGMDRLFELISHY